MGVVETLFAFMHGQTPRSPLPLKGRPIFGRSLGNKMSRAHGFGRAPLIFTCAFLHGRNKCALEPNTSPSFHFITNSRTLPTNAREVHLGLLCHVLAVSSHFS